MPWKEAPWEKVGSVVVTNYPAVVGYWWSSCSAGSPRNAPLGPRRPVRVAVGVVSLGVVVGVVPAIVVRVAVGVLSPGVGAFGVAVGVSLYV